MLRTHLHLACLAASVAELVNKMNTLTCGVRYRKPVRKKKKTYFDRLVSQFCVSVPETSLSIYYSSVYILSYIEDNLDNNFSLMRSFIKQLLDISCQHSNSCTHIKPSVLRRIRADAAEHSAALQTGRDQTLFLDDM